MCSSNVVWNDSEVFVLDHLTIAKLKELAFAHPLKRARICVHQDADDSVHEMVIAVHSESVIDPHRHPLNKPESYHVIEGELRVRIFDEFGGITQEILLGSEGHPRMYRIDGGVWHQPISVTEWTVYHEVATGPFLKEKDVIYASWE